MLASVTPTVVVRVNEMLEVTHLHIKTVDGYNELDPKIR